jgi:hypothetical protein
MTVKNEQKKPMMKNVPSEEVMRREREKANKRKGEVAIYTDVIEIGSASKGKGGPAGEGPAGKGAAPGKGPAGSAGKGGPAGNAGSAGSAGKGGPAGSAGPAGNAGSVGSAIKGAVSGAAKSLANVMSAPSSGTDNGTIKVEFQALYDYAYTEIKQCFCKGMSELFSDSMIPASDHIYKAIEKAIFVEIIDPESGKIMSQTNPEFENVISGQVESIVKKIMTHPDPQIKIDIHKNLGEGCQLTKEMYESENIQTTRKIPTMVLGGKNKYTRRRMKT